MSDFYNNSIFWVEVDKIRPNPYQPRREFDEQKLADLAESIRQYGVLQPLVVTRKEVERDDGGLTTEYELLAGERRLRASKLAGLSQVPVTIRTEEQTDQAKLEIAIIENLQREDLNVIDRAQAFKRLVDEFNFSHVEVGKRVGKSRVYVSNTIRILALPEEMQQALAAGKINEGHTRPLLMLVDKPEEQQTLFKEIMYRKLNVREAEKISRSIATDRVRKHSLIDPNIKRIEDTLSDTLGTRVSVEGNKESGGKLVIRYFSADDLEDLLARITAKQQEAADAAGTPASSLDVSDSDGEVNSEAAAAEEPVAEDAPPQKEDPPEEDDDLYAISKFSI